MELGAGLFFIGYFFFEIPSNILLHKLGARLWIARIMITWGLLSALFAFRARREWQFYILQLPAWCGRSRLFIRA